MNSYGEGEIIINSRRIGRVRILNLQGSDALYPRLKIKLGVDLQEMSDTEFEPHRPIEAYQMRELVGELRLRENAETVGPLTWTEHRRHVRSASYPEESHIDTACDLSAHVLERIEVRRNGGEAVFWLALWPTLVDHRGHLDAGIRPIRFVVPRDRWVETVTEFRSQGFSILELVFSLADASRFEDALTHVKDARARIVRGDYDESIASCRRALEAVASEVGISPKAEELKAFLVAVGTDDRHAKAYAGIASKIKELTNYTVHRSNALGLFSRAEAQFVLGVTEHLLVLTGALTSAKDVDVG